MKEDIDLWHGASVQEVFVGIGNDHHTGGDDTGSHVWSEDCWVADEYKGRSDNKKDDSNAEEG